MKILLVCTANICRSPMAEVVLKSLAESAGLGRVIRLNSAGTHAVKGRIDPRAKHVLSERGYSVSRAVAKNIGDRDLDSFDLILAMDNANIVALRRALPPDRWDRLKLFLDFAPSTVEREIPDPYYGNIEGFRRVLSLCEMAASGVLDEIRRGVGIYRGQRNCLF